MGTATDLGLGLAEFLFSLSSTFFTEDSAEFFRTGLRRAGELVTGGGETAGLQAKVTERPPAWPRGAAGAGGVTSAGEEEEEGCSDWGLV